MEKLIRRIVMPVILDAGFLPVLRRVAELAEKHHAELHLLYIGDPYATESYLWWLKPRVTHLSLIFEKMELLRNLRDIICREYTVRVQVAVKWGKWRNVLLNYAAANDSDLIVLNELAIPRKKTLFTRSHLEYIIEKSPCQVITLFFNQSAAKEWKQVVIPITDFIPELRLQTIMETAISQRMKIHLVTVNGGEVSKYSNDFYFLTETLKRLKPAGNIQVECRCLKNNFGPVDSFLQYARSIKADMLMTRMGINEKNNSRLKEMNLFLDH
jgi:nucleotide-binding universal stress UspA family protein